jgi:hypothetical protein
MFHRETLLVSSLLGIVFSGRNWLVDIRASFHMTGVGELFDSFIKTWYYLCMDLGMRTKHIV